DRARSPADQRAADSLVLCQEEASAGLSLGQFHGRTTLPRRSRCLVRDRLCLAAELEASLAAGTTTRRPFHFHSPALLRRPLDAPRPPSQRLSRFLHAQF